MKVFHYLVKSTSLGVVRDLYDPQDGFNAPNWSVSKSSYGLSLPRTTWFGTERVGGNSITVDELRSGAWAKTPGFFTDTGQVIGDRYLDTSGLIDVVSFSTNTTSPVEVTVYTSDDGNDPEFYEDEWEQFGPFSTGDEFDIRDSGRYVVFDFDFGTNDAPIDFEAYIRIEISKPIMVPLYSSTRQAVDKYPQWMSIRELPASDSDVVVTPASDNLGASVINALAGEWVEDIQYRIPYSEFQKFIFTADDSVLAWGYRVEGLPEYVHSVKGDGIELARTTDLQELKEAYSVYILDDDTSEQEIDDACWIDFNNQAVFTVKQYDSLTVNDDVDIASNQEPFHFWNQFDELGLFVGLDRMYLENNESFRLRILDVYQNRGSVGVEGFKNVLYRELGMLNETYEDIEILSMEDIEEDPKYFAPDGLPAKDENGAFPFVDLVRSISTLFPSTWGNFRWDNALWDVAGKDYEGYGVVPYRYDAELAPERYLQSGVGDGNDLFVHHPDTVTGPQEFEWTLKARTRRKKLVPEYPRIDFSCTVTPYGQIDVYDNPVNSLWLTVEIVTVGAVSYYLPFEISAKSDVDYYTLNPTRSSWGSASIFSDEDNKTRPGFRDINNVLYGATPASSATMTMGAITTTDLNFSVDNLSFEIAVDFSEFLTYSFSGNYGTTQALIDALNAEVLGATFSIDTDNLVVTSNSQGAISRVYIRNVQNPKTSGMEAGVGIANSGVDEGEIEASIPASDIATVKLHNGRLEYGVLREEETADTFKAWFSHEDTNFLQSTSPTPIEYAFSGQYPRIFMESKLTSFTTQEWTYDSFSYDVSVNGKAPYTAASPTTIQIPEIIWRSDAVSRGYKIQLLTTNTSTNFQGEEVVEYGVLTHTDEGESWFIPSDVLLVNGVDQQWSEDGLATITDSWTAVTFATTEYGLFPSATLYPSEELYPIGEVSYPVPNHVWEYEEFYLLTAPDFDTQVRSIAYTLSTVDENGPWRYNQPLRKGNMNSLLVNMEALRRYDFGIPEDQDLEVAWISPVTKDDTARVILWMDSHVVATEGSQFEEQAPVKAIWESREDGGAWTFTPFSVYARLKPLDSEWYPKITSGHFYDSGEEYYFYASQKSETTTESEILLQNVARQGAPLSITANKVGSALILSNGAHAVFQDINLLLPAEAHFDNFTGQWYGRRYADVSANDTTTPLFGSSVLFVAANESIVSNEYFTAALMRHVPVSAGQQYSFSFSIKAVQDKSFKIRTRMIWSDTTVSYSALVSSEYMEITPDTDWVRFSHTDTVPVGVSQVELAIDIFALDGEILEEADAVYIDGAMFAQGSTSEFIPSTKVQGDLDIRALVYVDERSSVDQTTILDKGSAYRFYMTPTGYLKLEYSTTTENFLVQSTTTLAPDVGGIWIRAQLRMDIGGFRNQIRFFTSTDGELWSAFGNPIGRTQSELTILDPAPGTLTVGVKNDGSTGLNGAVVKFEVRDGANGNIVAYADWSSNGPWSINSTESKTNSFKQLWSLEDGAYVYWQRYSPYVAEDSSLIEFRQTSFLDPESDTVKLSSKDCGYFQVSADSSVYLPYGDVYDVTVKYKDLLISADELSQDNRIEIYDTAVQAGDTVWVEYTPQYSYYVDNSVVDLSTGDQRSLVVFDKDANLAGFTEYEIVYEESYYDPATHVDLALNPLYTSQSEGFVFISHNVYPLAQVKLSVNPSTLLADGEDYVLVTINTLDNFGNPKPNQVITLATTFGSLEKETVTTDQDGFAIILLFSVLDELLATEIEATISADGGFVVETKFTVKPIPEKRSQLLAVTPSRRIPADGTSYNLIHGRLQDEDYTPIASKQIHWKKKRSIKELFTEDREGLRYYIPLSSTGVANLKAVSENKLDAATANLHYETGAWAIMSDWTAFALSEVTSTFGETSVLATRYDNIGAIILTAGRYAATAGQQYTFSCDVRPATRDRDATVEVRWLDAGELLISYVDSVFPTQLGQWTRASLSAVAPVNTAYIEVIVRWQSCEANESHYLDAACLTQGTRSSFAPAWDGLGSRELVLSFEPSSYGPMGIVGFRDSGSGSLTGMIWLDTNGKLRVSIPDGIGGWVDSVSSMGVSVALGELASFSISYNPDTDPQLYEVRFVDPVSGAWKRAGVLQDATGSLEGDELLVGNFSSVDFADFYGSIFYVALRDKSSDGAYLLEGDFTESGPWSRVNSAQQNLNDSYGTLWSIQNTSSYENTLGTLDLTTEIAYALSQEVDSYFVEAGTVNFAYDQGCLPAEGETGVTPTGQGYRVITTDGRDRFVFTGNVGFNPIQCDDPDITTPYVDTVDNIEAHFAVVNDAHGVVTTDSRGRFTVGPFFSSDRSGYWFCSVESYELSAGDVVSWFEYPVIMHGVESPENVPDLPVQNNFNYVEQPYSEEQKYTVSSYDDDATIQEKLNVDIVWLPPSWYALSAYTQYQLGVEGHYVYKSV